MADIEKQLYSDQTGMNVADINAMSPVLLISAGTITPKKTYNGEQVPNLYLNYGLLGLATELSKKGYHAQMFQGDTKTIPDFLKELDTVNIDISTVTYPILISVISFLSVSWANALMDAMKQINPNLRFVAGGRWVLDKNLDWVKEHMPLVDFFSTGCPDEVVENLLFSEKWSEETLLYPSYKHIFPHLDYTLLHNFRYYSPVLEVSRGCGMGCKFCLENSFPALKPKTPDDVIKEVIELTKVYGSNQLCIYFESSMFLPTLEWANRFLSLYQQYSLTFLWRFTTRVDCLNPGVIEPLSKAGLKAIDFGLESASVTQLVRMNKSKNPKEYLHKAETVAKTCSANGVWCKFNILLYMGETYATINETKTWLQKNRDFFKGVSANPLTVYLNGPYTESFISEIESVSGRAVSRETLYATGMTYVDLSEEISKETAKELSVQIANEFMTGEDFYDLKMLCYLPRKMIDKNRLFPRGNKFADYDSDLQRLEKGKTRDKKN